MTRKQELWFTFLATLILMNVTDGLISIGYMLVSLWVLYTWWTDGY
jgi:hypothetical protein